MTPFQKQQQQARERERLRKLVIEATKNLTDFFITRKGRLVYFSDDAPFAALLRQCVKPWAKNDPVIRQGQDLRSIHKIINEWLNNEYLPAFVLERNLKHSGPTTHILRETVKAFPDLNIISCGFDIDPAQENLLLEFGSKHIITKPVDEARLLVMLGTYLAPPDNIEKLLDIADKKLRDGDSQGALQMAGTIMKAAPERTGAYIVAGDCYKDLGDNKKAGLAYMVGAKKDPEALAPIQKMADLANSEGNQELELVWLKKLDNLSPLNGARKLQMAELEMDLGNPRSACQLLDQAGKKLEENFRERLRNVSTRAADAIIAMEPGNGGDEDAERALRRNLALKEGKLNQEDMIVFNKLGLVLRRQGKTADAILEYKKALKIVPDAPEILYNLAMAFVENLARKNALKTLQRLLASQKDFSWATNEAVWGMAILFVQGKFWQEAVPCLEEAERRGVKDAPTHLKAVRTILEKIEKSQK